MPRVAITTTADRASTLSERALAHGLEPVILPCIEVLRAPHHLLERARAATSQADWLVVASARAVTSVWPDGGIPDVAVAAVGRHTAAAVEAAGGRVELVGDGGAADLVNRLAPAVAGRSAVFAHGSGTDRSLVDALKRSAGAVTALAVYETRPIAPGPAPVDAVMFGSPSAVDGWCRSRSLDDLVLAAIGKATEKALVGRGRQAQVVPPHPEFDALVALLAAFLGARNPV